MPTNCTVCSQLYLHKSGLSRHVKSHQQQQLSTCGQCGKTFNRADNLAKHLKHCTGHNQPPPQQQQQTAAPPPPPPKFTIDHQYSSMGVAMERYNINMQETQHLVHLSTALHLLPTMTQGGGSERCHTTTSYPNFGNDCCVCSRYRTTCRRRNRQLVNFIEVFELNGSRWVFSNFQWLQLTLWQLDPLPGSAFIPGPRWIQVRRAVVNVAGTE